MVCDSPVLIGRGGGSGVDLLSQGVSLLSQEGWGRERGTPLQGGGHSPVRGIAPLS